MEQRQGWQLKWTVQKPAVTSTAGSRPDQTALGAALAPGPLCIFSLMLKPYSFKVSAESSSLTPYSEHRKERPGWPDNSRQGALKAPCQKLLESRRS